MRPTKSPFSLKIIAGICLLATGTSAIADQNPLIIRAEIENNQIADFDFVNSVVGWNDFFLAGFRGSTSTIGILESGQAWSGHEVFDRPLNSPAAITAWQNNASGALNQIDYHATTVAHVLVGGGNIPNNADVYTLGDFAGLGMAPAARVVSGGIATEFSSTEFGAFSISQQSYINAYRDFFRGTGLGNGINKLDVINSSWGGSGDLSANSIGSLSLDGLALQNLSVAHVISAGNDGNIAVSSPANSFNNISVGSLGDESYNDPSTFSSNGLVDFYNPVTNETFFNARVAVDIAAPGENLFLAAYLGNSGSIGAALPGLVQEPSPNDRYFTAVSGTSYSAPIVAGGIALLKDVARLSILGETPETHPDSFDTRVMKSVIMAGSQATNGWDNGQNEFNVTTQALDTTTGAGRLDLLGAADVFLAETRGEQNFTGGDVSSSGWNLTTINLAQSIDFIIDTAFTETSSLTVALNWFAVRGFTDAELGQDIAFANLDLQVWRLNEEGGFAFMVGESRTTYNNTEFLRISSLSPGEYAMRVLFPGMIYDTTNSISTETFALAWSSAPIPEPSIAMFASLSLIFIFRIRRRSPV